MTIESFSCCHADIKRVELAPLRPFHILRPSTAIVHETSSAKPHLYDIIHPSKHPDNRTHCLPSRYNKGMSCIHTIYGALTATIVLMDNYESVEVSRCQNTKRIVNAFFIHKSKCRPLLSRSLLPSVYGQNMLWHISPEIHSKVKNYLLQNTTPRLIFSVF